MKPQLPDFLQAGHARKVCYPAGNQMAVLQMGVFE